MPCLSQICRYLETFAPADLAEDWDNVGLLVGRREQPVSKIMTCLTVTPVSCAEAIDSDADLIVAHHPLPFRPLKRITDETTTGSILLNLLDKGIAVYSPHTAFDSAASGINRQLAELIGVEGIQPLLPWSGDQPQADDQPQIGAGRFGLLPKPTAIGDIVLRLKAALKSDQFRLVGDPLRSIHRVAVACGSGGQFLSESLRVNCDLMITGETTFHTCLEAAARGIDLLLVGHFPSERFAVETLAESLALEFQDAHVWASQRETDPLVVV